MKRFVFALTITAMLLFAVMVAMTDSRPFAYAAPNAAVTPVAVKDPRSGKIGAVIPLVTAVVTADYQKCVDTRDYYVADVQTVIDQVSTPNAVTIKIEHSVDNVNFVDGPQILATVTADNDYLNRYDLYGAYTCANIDIATASTTNTVGVKILMLPRQ